MLIAQGVDIGETFPIARNFPSLSSIITKFFPIALIAGSIIFFILVVIAGFGVVSGAGKDDPHAKEQAKNFLTYAVIGLLIMFSSYWILQIINFVTNGSLGGILGT